MGVMDLRRRIMLNEPHIVTPASAGLQTFRTDVVAPLKECKVHFSPVQEGTGDPSPSNVRPISGWTGVEVERRGKNLIDVNALTGTSSIWWNGKVTIGYANHCVTPKISVKPNTQYCLYRNSYNQGYVSEFDSNGVFLRQTARGTSSTFTTGSDVYFLGITVGTEYKETAQLELGSTATAYEPYHGQTLPIDWTTEAGTVYGGYVDLVKGEVVRDWFINTHEVAATDGTPGGTGTGGDTNYRFVAWNLASAHLPDTERYKQAVCNILPYSNLVGSVRFWLGGGTVYSIFPNDGQAYSVVIVYPERNLNISTYSINPIILKTLRGTNNIWSNANGDIDISYWAH